MKNNKTRLTMAHAVLIGLGLLFISIYVNYSMNGVGYQKTITLSTGSAFSIFLFLVAGICLVTWNIRTLRKTVKKERQERNIAAEINALTVACLTELQFYTRSLIDSNIESTMVIDNMGIIFDVNREAERALGFQRNELIGTSFRQYCTDEENAFVSLLSIVKEEKINDVELYFCNKFGVIIPFECNSAILYDSHEKIIGINISMRDVTKQKKFESLLEENNLELHKAMDIAERANLAKSTFLSNMSHELRTPLNAILGFAQLIDTEEQISRTTQKLSVKHILQGGWYLLDLINEILDLASIESGKVNLTKETISLFEVMTECHTLIAQQARKKNVKLFFPQADHSTMYVNADQTRLKQVLINLLSNAVKYNRSGGEVLIQCEMRNANVVWVSVKDTGFGMTADQLSHLFEPFNRLGRESSIEDGTGIGLVVTRQLIQLMNGRIGVESHIGVGSTFWFELPASQNSPQISEVTPDVMTDIPSIIYAKPGKYKLLYVEDNPVNLSLIEQLILPRGDIELHSAVTGAQGIQMALTELPDAILLDINLPDMNGFDLIRSLKQYPSTMHIPVIALSANAMRSDIERGLQSGCRHYLTKPVKVIELMEKLDETLRSVSKGNATQPDSASVVANEFIPQYVEVKKTKANFWK